MDPISKNIFFLFLSLLFLNCGGSKQTMKHLDAEDRFAIAKQKFNEGNYLEAIEDFSVITLQFQGSSVADSAQFYLGECRYNRGEYILAAAEYEALIRNMSSSKLVPDSRFKIAMCYYNLSPKPELDQKYTLKAIDAFQTFIEYHPTHSLVSVAEAKIRELNDKLAKKEYEAGIIYIKGGNYKAATQQFDYVLEKYHDTDYADRALIAKIEALVARKRYADAKIEVTKFFEKYPTSPLRERAESLKADIENHLKTQSQTTSDGERKDSSILPSNPSSRR